jgi:carbon-monoxide dehydrogenase medium subunit
MIPVNFDYVAAKSVDEALELLGRHGADAKLLAGGHSLIPLMKLRLAVPSVLIDLGRIAELRYVRDEGSEIAVGGMTTYYTLASSEVVRQKAPLLAEAATAVGDVQVRNRGTIGGSLVHSDPASDMAAAVLALDARMILVGPSGKREVPAGSFFVGMLQSAVGPNEILTEIRFKKSQSNSGAAYLKLAQPASGFALVGVAARVTFTGAKCSEIAVAVTGVAPKPFRAASVEARLRGSSLDAETLALACADVAEGVEALSDIHASAEYRKAVASVYARRSLETARTRARA